ncbi:MAG: AMP-binding protein [Pacificimonas sp.]
MSAVPAGWPAKSLTEIQDILCAEGQPFEMETMDIRGVPTRVWKHLHPNLRALAEHARGHGDHMFLMLEEDRISYGSWFRAVAALSADLIARGVKPGDRVAIAMRNLPEFPAVFFAAVCVGAIAVPLNAWWTGEEMAYALADCGATTLYADGARWARIAPERPKFPALETVILARAERSEPGTATIESIVGRPGKWRDLPAADLPPVEIAPDDRAVILYTSGTTGKPKGALGTHRNMLTNILSTSWANARSVMRRGAPLPEPTKKVMLTVIPMFHATALSATLMGVMQAGHSMIFMRKWDVIEAFEIIQREKVNATGGVPTIAWQMIEHPDREKYDLSSLESVSYGGAPSAPELVRKIKSVFGSAPGNGWGMSETMATVTSHSGEDYLNRPESAGPPVPVRDLKITSEDGAELPVGQVGELWARGPQIVEGYWNRPEASAETFVEGWVRTGDLARLDEEGFVYIVDRAKDIIIRGGENIYSSEVENVLYDHPAVTDCALIAIPHRTLGEEPAAVVHLGPGMSATEDELRAHVRQHLAPFKVPVRVAFTNETLPRNANGKILKRELGVLFK